MKRLRNQQNTKVDLTQGPIIPGIVQFAVPMFLGQLLQQLYNMGMPGSLVTLPKMRHLQQ